jgi:hypothetical protein
MPSSNEITTATINIPASNSRLLIVTSVSTEVPTSVNFNQGSGSPLVFSLATSGVQATLNLRIYYLVLPGTAAISGTVTVRTASNSSFGVFVRAFDNVDTANPIDAAANSFNPSSNSNISVPTQADDMVIDLRVASSALTLGALGQVDLAPPLSANLIRSTYRTALTGTTAMFNATPAAHLITAINFGPQEIDIRGNSVSIASGDMMPNEGDHTDFGKINYQSGKISRTFTIHNTGNANLALTGGMPLVVIGGAHPGDFTIKSGPNILIGPKSNTSFTIEFDPSEKGDRTATVSIANDDADENPYTFAIAGTGLATDIPTMGQWGLFLFTLLLLNLGLGFVRLVPVKKY